MSKLDIIRGKLKEVGFSDFQDWSFDFRNQGAKNIGYFVQAKSNSTGKVKEKVFYGIVDPELWPALARDDDEQKKMMDVFREYLLNNFDEFIG